MNLILNIEDCPVGMPFPSHSDPYGIGMPPAGIGITT